MSLSMLNYSKLSAMRRYVIVLNFIIGALLTTPRVLTQALMAIFLQLLFEAVVWTTWYRERSEKRRAPSSLDTGN
jgi:sec-independent protein translocase protein TatC